MNKNTIFTNGIIEKTPGQPAIIPPITIADIKKKLKYDIDIILPDEDVIQSCIDTAINKFEQKTGLILINTLFDCYLAGFSNYFYSKPRYNQIFCNQGYYDEIFLIKHRNINEVLSISYTKNDDISSILDAVDYRMEFSKCGCTIKPNSLTGFPIDYKISPQNTSLQRIVKIQYKAGFGDDTPDIPKNIINFLISYASYLYENCSSCNEDDIPKEIISLIYTEYHENYICSLENSEMQI